MFAVCAVLANSRYFSMLRAQVGLPGVLRTHSTSRNELFQILPGARWTPGCRRRVSLQVFERGSAMFTTVFVNRHVLGQPSDLRWCHGGTSSAMTRLREGAS